MGDNFDRRITPARSDLAAAFLKDQVEAARFAEGVRFSVARGHVSVRARPQADAAQESELLHGEGFTVYEEKNGWSWGQGEADGYVGYVESLCLRPPEDPPTHRVTALSTPLLIRPEVKAAATGFLPMNALVRTEKQFGVFVQTDAGFVFGGHLAPRAEAAPDFAAVAERFIGVPYVWGGKTAAGLDCSGLVQTALAAAGIAAPRDTDMMEKHFTQETDTPRRGDLVFWKGHMGLMLDGARLLHANAFHMMVAAEPLAEAVARIEKETGPVTSIKRPLCPSRGQAR